MCANASVTLSNCGSDELIGVFVTTTSTPLGRFAAKLVLGRQSKLKKVSAASAISFLEQFIGFTRLFAVAERKAINGDIIDR